MLLLISFVSLCSGLQGQIFSSAFILQKYPTFNSAEIKKAGISSIILREMEKPSSRPIYDVGKRFTYYFNEQGELAGYRKTFPGHRGRVDTILLNYEVSNGEVAAIHEKRGSYERKTLFDPIDSNSIRQSIYTKRRGEGWEEMAIELVKTEKLTSGYVDFIGGMNSEPYQRIIHQLDNQGRAISVEVWNGSRAQSLESWKYEKGQLVEYSYENLLDVKAVEITFTLDAGEYCENEKCLELSRVQHENGWPKGWIFMNRETQDMEIWEFDYRYR